MGALRGLSDVKIPTAISFASYWIVAVPICYYLGIVRGPSAVGVWWGLACGLAFAATALTARFIAKTSAGGLRPAPRVSQSSIDAEAAMPPGAV